MTPAKQIELKNTSSVSFGKLIGSTEFQGDTNKVTETHDSKMTFLMNLKFTSGVMIEEY
jgi:hypothetical protein